jgi:hypothetical protein
MSSSIRRSPFPLFIYFLSLCVCVYQYRSIRTAAGSERDNIEQPIHLTVASLILILPYTHADPLSFSPPDQLQQLSRPLQPIAAHSAPLFFVVNINVPI